MSKVNVGCLLGLAAVFCLCGCEEGVETDVSSPPGLESDVSSPLGWESDVSSLLGKNEKDVRGLLGGTRGLRMLLYALPDPATPPFSKKEYDAWKSRQLYRVMEFEKHKVAINAKELVFAVVVAGKPGEPDKAKVDQIKAGLSKEAVLKLLGPPDGAQSYKDISGTPPLDPEIIRGWAKEPPVTVLWYGPVRIIVGEDGNVVTVDKPAKTLWDSVKWIGPSEPTIKPQTSKSQEDIVMEGIRRWYLQREDLTMPERIVIRERSGRVWEVDVGPEAIEMGMAVDALTGEVLKIFPGY